MRFSAPRSRAYVRSAQAPEIPPVMATAAWSTALPKGYIRINIARGQPPSNVDRNTLRYGTLVPRMSATDIPAELFHRQYVNQLANLDPEFVFHEIRQWCRERVPVLCAWIYPETIAKGKAGCHRHLVADWLERGLDIKVPELGQPKTFRRFDYWTAHPIAPSVPGDRPRTGPAPTYSKADKAAMRLGQYRFKF